MVLKFKGIIFVRVSGIQKRFCNFFVNKTFKTVGNALKVEKEERYYIQFHFDTQFFFILAHIDTL